jgi:hypothetical protein
VDDQTLARKRIRDQMLWPLLFTSLAGIVLIVVGVTSQDQVDAWLAWISGGGLLVLNLGMWFAQHWARLGYGILGTVLCTIAVYGLAVGKQPLNLDTVDKPILWGLIAIFAFMPSTKRAFDASWARADDKPA